MSELDHSSSSASGLVIERLSQDHDLTDFDCSNSRLNVWLQRFAWTNQRAETAKTYVAHRDRKVVGFYSLVAGSVSKAEVPERVAHGLANHPVGVVLLARLAVHRSEQGRGIGKALLRDSLIRISQAADIIGVRAVLVHAIDEHARNFYLRHNFQASPIDPLQLMLLMKDLRASI